ncbi:phosphatase PAP2 family protein [Herminiimonas glaciei]|uniref:Phosphatase PAP2 family protein n=1 Tax=Herminiimonas glaciei TaxID=523788 RepID=A0ABW2I8Q8_9BURK
MINSLQRYFYQPNQQFSSLRIYFYRERLKALVCLLGIILPFVLFLVMADKIRNGGLLALERAFLWALRVQAESLPSHFAVWISMLVTVLSVCMLCYLLYRQLWRTALFWLLAIAGAATLGNVMKGLIQRARPELWLDTAATSFGFPSGHATHSMAIVVALLVLLRVSSWHTTALLTGLVFAALVGLSRMYLGYHYPSDILAGWMLALFWVMTLRVLFKHSYLTLDHRQHSR